MSLLATQFFSSIGDKIKSLKKHPLCVHSRPGCSAGLFPEAFTAHKLLKSQLVLGSQRLLFEQLHRISLNTFAILGSKIRRKLIFKFPVTHRQTPEVVDYDLSVASVHYDVEPEVAKLIGLILKAGGFVKNEAGVFVASDDDAILAVFGPAAMRGGLNFLFRSKFFPARSIYALSPTHKGKLCDPTSASDTVIYSIAKDELGLDADSACDGGTRMKPAWVLRQLLEKKLTYGTRPDWRVMGVASVRVDRSFTVAMRDKKTMVHGAEIAKVVTITVTFSFNSGSRTHPGDSLPRALFCN